MVQTFYFQSLLDKNKIKKKTENVDYKSFGVFPQAIYIWLTFYFIIA